MQVMFYVYIFLCKYSVELLHTSLLLFNFTHHHLKEGSVMFCFFFNIDAISGAYAANWSGWRSLLLSLYDALIGEIGQISSRGKYVTGSRHVAVKDSLIELTAHICHQVRLQQRCSCNCQRSSTLICLLSVHAAVQ